ncbi:type II toxin-antitoxin system RelE/ParE family toxin [Flavobacterium psychrotrophum]|uniref:type II toxin-antitoxin system RelE/ParE family toxin n=1 Tax=Flavobacterium psychrotrophum TaxID=2294119 RepID=UPI000E316476|nr:type II toxin-antitoxin system RelE/ParE family toxin [Flavobacterium psychrotrophum]
MKVVFSDLANKKAVEVSDYLSKEWSEKVKKDFAETLRSKIMQISSFPESCIESAIFHKLRICVVTKQTSFLYRINNNEIEVITVFDNRSSFTSVTKEIRKYYGRI